MCIGNAAGLVAGSAAAPAALRLARRHAAPSGFTIAAVLCVCSGVGGLGSGVAYGVRNNLLPVGVRAGAP